MSTSRSLIVGVKDLPDNLDLSWAQLDEQFRVQRMSQAFYARCKRSEHKSSISHSQNFLVPSMLNSVPILLGSKGKLWGFSYKMIKACDYIFRCI